MNGLTRRDFLKWVGAGGAAIVALSAGARSFFHREPVGAVGRFGTARTMPFSFRAATGLPATRMPSYASLVVEGSVDPSAGTGRVKRALFAGAPAAQSEIELPGTSRWFRVAGVREEGRWLLVRGVAENPRAFGPGESRTALFRIDRAGGRVLAPFVDSDVELRLVG